MITLPTGRLLKLGAAVVAALPGGITRAEAHRIAAEAVSVGAAVARQLVPATAEVVLVGDARVTVPVHQLIGLAEDIVEALPTLTADEVARLSATLLALGAAMVPGEMRVAIQGDG